MGGGGGEGGNCEVSIDRDVNIISNQRHFLPPIIVHGTRRPDGGGKRLISPPASRIAAVDGSLCRFAGPAEKARRDIESSPTFSSNSESDPDCHSDLRLSSGQRGMSEYIASAAGGRLKRQPNSAQRPAADLQDAYLTAHPQRKPYARDREDEAETEEGQLIN